MFTLTKETEVLNAANLDKGNCSSIDFTGVRQSSKHFKNMLMEKTPVSFFKIDLRNSIVEENTLCKSLGVFG